MHNNMSFPCVKCGLCCRNIDKIPQLKAFDTGNGTCRYLINNLCSIYENRPEICCVDLMYERYFSDKMTRDEFYKLNKKGCVELLNKNKDKTEKLTKPS